MRLPYQVLVIPYRKVDDIYQFAIFSRADMDCWQWIAGGGEDNDESILESAKREAYEEACISKDLDFIRLDTLSSIPTSIFGDGGWDDNIYVIPEYSFAVCIEGSQLIISKEHKEFKWVEYKEAYELLKYDSNRTALWELAKRIKLI